MRIFSFPYNYEGGAVTYTADSSYAQGALAPELSDGRDDTSNASEYYVMDFEGTDRKSIDSVFVETSGFDNISVEADTGAGGGGSITNHVINADAQRRGTRHYAFVPSFTISASRLRVAFGGGPGRVYRIAVTRQLLNIDTPRWTGIAHRRIGEGNETRRNILGNTVVIESRSGRWKTTTDFTGIFLAGDTPTADQLIATFERSAALFIYPLPTSQPTRFYPAAIDPPRVSEDYIGRQPNQQVVEFTVREL